MDTSIPQCEMSVRKGTKRDDVEMVLVFENRGPEVGATIAHPHGQIYAYPFVPPTTAQMLRSTRTYAERVGTNLFGDLLAAELREWDDAAARRWSRNLEPLETAAAERILAAFGQGGQEP